MFHLLITILLALGTVHGGVLAGQQKAQDCTLMSSKGSSSRYCGVYGMLKQKKVKTLPSLASASANSLTTCATSCQNQPGCVSFGYTGPGSCQLFSASLKDMGLSITATGSTLFYNAGCWKTACKASPKTPSCVCTSTLTGQSPFPPHTNYIV